MGREVRRVADRWEHPCYGGRYKPLHPGEYYPRHVAEFMEHLASSGLQSAIDECGRAPDQNDYMPNWPEEERTHFMMYESVSEGTPISPSFKTAEELARWLADNKASAGPCATATYDQWLSMIRMGSAPSMIMQDGRLMSGVEFIGNHPTTQEEPPCET